MFSPQLQQTVNLLFIVVLSYLFAHLYIDWKMFIVILFFTLFIENLFIYMKYHTVNYLSFSSLTTALGVMLMMFAENIWIYLFVITLGLWQKHFLKLEGRHFFNPSNFALLMAMLFFYNDAHIVLGQLGDELYLRMLVIVMGIVILSRVERLLIPITFILLYIVMQYIFVVSYDVTMILEDIYLRFYSVSFILFILFMLTDPHTTPKAVWAQMVFSFFVATLSVGLDRYFGFRVQHLFMALFILSPFVVLYEVHIAQRLEVYAIAKCVLLIFLVLSVIIFIESKPPYYFEMD